MFIKDITNEKEKSPKVVIYCELCSYKSNRKSNFDRHIKSMHEESQNPFQCCGQVFINKASLKNHSKEYHKDGYQCDQCQRLFPRKALLRRHQTVHNGIKEFSCPKCGYETSHKSNLERHCSRVHNLNIGTSKASKLKKKVCPETSNSTNQRYFQTSNNNSCSETDELSSSQELISSQELMSSRELMSSQESLYRKFESTSINDERVDDFPIDPNPEVKFGTELLKAEFLSNQNLSSETIDDINLKDEELKTDNKRLRLCLRPYKCLICWLLFESQLEYFEHQILTNHTVEDNSDELEVIRAAAVLTQLRRSASDPLFKF